MDVASNRTVDYALRALQLLFAVIVIGTDGFGINSYHGYPTRTDTSFGVITGWHGVPNSWGFLIFCAAWTFLAVIFHSVVGTRVAKRALIDYVHITVEVIAALSWFAGFIAVAVSLGTDTCPEKTCGSLTAATVFGAAEWLLFLATALSTALLAWNNKRQLEPSTTGPAVRMRTKT